MTSSTTLLPTHNQATAPKDAQETLGVIVEKYGFLPNLAGVIANSPPVLGGFLGLAQSFDEGTMTLTPVERQVVLLATSVTNSCDYCIAAHSMLADMNGLTISEIEALLEGGPMKDARLDALRAFTVSIVANRGYPDESALATFLGVGFKADQILEVILGVTIKTFTNYTNHIADTPINEQFAAYAPKKKVA